VDCIAGQYGGSNIAVNPIYCYRAQYNFTLRSDSVCLPGASPCGQLIGALGQGCTPGGGGCPYLYVNDGSAFVQDNTLMAAVEPERAGLDAADVTDLYLLGVPARPWTIPTS